MNSSKTPSTHKSVGPIQASSPRLLVTEVNLQGDALIIHTLESSRFPRRILVVLCDEWIESVVPIQSIIRVILTNADGSYQSWHSRADKSTVVVTRKFNLFVLNPDTLISGTTVADSFMCLRKSVLGTRVPSGSISNTAGGEAALFGSLIHHLLQTILVMDSSTRDYSTSGNISQSGVDHFSFHVAAEEILSSHAEDLYACNVSDKHARKVLLKIIPEVLEWYDQFMGSGNFQTTSGVDIKSGKEYQNIVVREVHDIEELVWSPVFGLKGKIDASMQFQVNGETRGIGVFELKTGKSSGHSAISHTAQVTMYSLLLSHRYDTIINQALLTYIRYQEALKSVREAEENCDGSQDKIQLLQTQAVYDEGPKHKFITSVREEIIGIIMQRNKLASYLYVDADVTNLPPLLQGKEALCEKCFFNDSCLMQHKFLENGSDETVKEGPGTKLFHEKTSHLTEAHSKYYSYWKGILAAEERTSRRHSNEIWTMRGADREAKGKCLSNLMLVWKEEASQNAANELIDPGQYREVTFTRHVQGSIVSDFSQTGIAIGAFVVVSAENITKKKGSDPELSIETWQTGLTNGFVQSITANTISVKIDRSLLAWTLHQGVDPDAVSWRVDIDEMYSSHSIAKRSLEKLFMKDDGKMSKIRSLIIDRTTPTFGGFQDKDLSNEIDSSSETAQHIRLLNSEQKHALDLSLCAKDYMLILGMPGTGKSTTLISIVLTAAAEGKSVLLCSHTNSAVDNLLCKLLDAEFTDFIRLGRNLRVINNRIHPYHISKIFVPGKSTEQLVKEIDAPRVVATTCLGINHVLFSRRSEFDLTVIDEASQILQPICTGSLQFTKGAFILVGDHYQLPPLEVASQQKNRMKEDKGFSAYPDVEEKMSEKNLNGTQESESLFRRLCAAHPSTMVSLSKQYRMAEEIMRLSNELFYGGSLSCGAEEVASQRLDISVSGLRDLNGWRKAVRNPSYRVVFLDIHCTHVNINETIEDNPNIVTNLARKKYCSTIKAKRDNEAEANTIIETVLSLIRGGVKIEDITILSMFRAQVNLIKQKLKNASNDGKENVADVEVCTVDQYQGKDNKCVILSFVRNTDGKSDFKLGPLLEDWRRINVALTRAKQKLILVGHADSLAKGSFVLRRMISYLKSKKSIYSVAET